MSDDDDTKNAGIEPMPVQPGTVDEDAIVALLDEYPWTYQKTSAAAGSGLRLLAMTTSRNRVALKPARDQGAVLHLKIEQWPGDAPAVHLALSNAETDCDLIEGCRLTLTLDGSDVESFQGEIATSDMNTDLVVSEPVRFIAMLKTAQTASVAVPLRDNGTKAFVFVVHSLHWPPLGTDL